MTLVSVVVPVYCNAGSLPILHERLVSIAQQHADKNFEFIFVDDGSFDDSYNILAAIAKNDNKVQIIKLSRNFGSNIALAAGLHYAQGNCAAMIAADLQDPPELISPMLDLWDNGTHVVMAARRQRADPLLTRLPAAIFNRAFRQFVFRDFPTNGYDFVLIDRKVIDVVVSCAEKNSYIFGLIMWAGFSRETLLYDRVEREHGSSMWTFTKKIKYFIDAFSAFSYIPLRIASATGMIFAAIGLIYTFIVLLARFLGGVPVEGWASLMIVLLIASGTQLIILGLLGEYIWRGLEQSRKRPLFVVEQAIKNDNHITCGISDSLGQHMGVGFSETYYPKIIEENEV